MFVMITVRWIPTAMLLNISRYSAVCIFLKKIPNMSSIYRFMYTGNLILQWSSICCLVFVFSHVVAGKCNGKWCTYCSTFYLKVRFVVELYVVVG